MAYRREDKAHGTYADIWVVALDDHLQPIADTNKKIELPRPHPDTGLFEDPRLFLIGGEIYLSFIAATIEKGKHCAAQGLARLSGGWKVGAVAYPDYGTNRNDASCGNGVGQGEKNWTFYEHKGAVRCLYSTEPCSVFELSGERCFDVAKTWSVPEWSWGRLSGSTPLIPYQGKLLGMFHSFLHNVKTQRDYYAGWFVFCPQENRITAISRAPAIQAERDPSKDRRGVDQSWKPNAIFPCGLIEHNGQYVVSYGWQDSLPMLAKFSPQEIEGNLRPLDKWEQRQCLRDSNISIPGGFSFTVGELKCKATSWPRVRKWCKLNNVSIDEAEKLVCSNLQDKYKTTKLVRVG